MLGLKKPTFRAKNTRFEKSHNAENCKKNDPLRFYNNQSVAKYQKIEGGPFGDFTKMSKKKRKMRILNSPIVPKNLKERTPWDFVTFVVAKYQNKLKGGPFEVI